MPTIRQYFNKKWTFGSGSLKTITEKENKYIFSMNHVERGFGFTNINEDEIIELIQNNNSFIGEILHNYPKKVYFDIDGTDPNELSLEKVKDIIKKYFGDQNMAISGYETEEKKSYHIVLYDLILKDDLDLLELKKVVKTIKQYDCPYFDWKVYTRNRMMKCVYQSKPNKPIQQIIENTNIKNHLITVFFNGNETQFKFTQTDQLPIVETKINDIIIDTVYKLDQNFDIEMLNDNKKLLMLMPCNQNTNHSISWICALFCFNNGLTFDDFWEWRKQKDNQLNKWKKHWENIQLSDYSISVNRFIMILSMYYPELNNIEKPLDLITNKFINGFKLDGISIDKITASHFNTDNKVIIFNIGMGGGKTTMTVDYLKTNNKKFIWITPRRALVMNTVGRFIDNDMNVTNYLDAKPKNKQSYINNSTNLIIQAESLHYLESTTKYDVLVIDEIESVLNGWMSSTHDRKLEENFKNFKNLFKNCKKIILLDAFTSRLTMNFLKSLDINNTIIYQSQYKPSQKILIENDDYKKTINKICNDLNGNKKLYVFYAFKNGNDKRYSIEQLKDYIESHCPNKKVLIYHSGVSDKQTKTLYDVNNNWSSFDCILCTSSITVGVNYEKLDYDKIYLMVSGFCNQSRDIIQTSMRIRKTKEDKIELYFFDINNKNILDYNTYYKEKEDMIYNNLIDDIHIEKRADFKTSFLTFCSLTNYISDNVLNYIEKKNKKFINELYTSKMLMPYATISILTDQQIKEYETNYLFNCNTSFTQKFEIAKYYFNQRYQFMTNNHKELIWNNNHSSFFNKIDSTLITLIKNDNKIKYLDELNLNKPAKLSQETKDYIKITYDMDDIKNESLKIKNLINHELGTKVIDLKQIKNHWIYEFTDTFETLHPIYLKYHNTNENLFN